MITLKAKSNWQVCCLFPVYEIAIYIILRARDAIIDYLYCKTNYICKASRWENC